MSSLKAKILLVDGTLYSRYIDNQKENNVFFNREQVEKGEKSWISSKRLEREKV